MVKTLQNTIANLAMPVRRLKGSIDKSDAPFRFSLSCLGIGETPIQPGVFKSQTKGEAEAVPG
jgi:hypothetical protein